MTVFRVEKNANHDLEISHRGYLLETGGIVLFRTGKELLSNDHVKSAVLGF